MNDELFGQICSVYALGAPIAAPERIFGGLIHRMYRARTIHGQFAIKLLSVDTLVAPGYGARLRQGERIAAAVAASGLPAVAALEASGEVIHTIRGETALVYPWIDGRTLASTSAGPQRAAQIGSILGRMHGLALPFPEPIPSAGEPFSKSEWSDLADRASETGGGWAESLRYALSDLERWESVNAQAQEALAGTWALSHGDLHQQNVLWTDGKTPWLIDWEAAGWQLAPKEAVVCALEWSGFVEGAPDLPTFRALLEAYRREFPLSTADALQGLNACFGNWLGWLRFCVQRALGDSGLPSQERAENARQIPGTLATVRRVESALPDLRHACRE